MRLKKGIRLHGIHPETVVGMMIVDPVYEKYGQELIITSVSEGNHSERSAHYRGFAFDCRTRYFDQETQQLLKIELRDELGPDFTVILEDDHMHISWTPRKL